MAGRSGPGTGRGGLGRLRVRVRHGRAPDPAGHRLADPYPLMPSYLVVYFVSLTLLDPATAVLLALRRVEGVVLAALVLFTDALANAYANYVVDDAAGVTPGRIGQAVISVLSVGQLLLTPWLVRWFRPERR